MKRLTKNVIIAAFAMMMSSFMVVEPILGIHACGGFVFCYIYDPEFRRIF